MGIEHEGLRGRVFAADLVRDEYYPDGPVALLQGVLVRLCERIEAERPADLESLYALTEAATEEINELQDAFWDAGSEIETVARDSIATEVELIAHSYGFAEADLEEMLALRDW
ncbi:MAG TPA: DUF5713 family protein [Iamia sp.]